VRLPVARVGGVEDVFGDRGQVDLLVDGEPAFVAREDKQRADEVLGVIARGADVRRDAAQIAGRACGVAEHAPGRVQRTRATQATGSATWSCRNRPVRI
jgi:hypothetical protein